MTTSTCQRCDICRTAVVCRPRVLTVLGPRDLCAPCYFRYTRIVDELANYFNHRGQSPATPNVVGAVYDREHGPPNHNL